MGHLFYSLGLISLLLDTSDDPILSSHHMHFIIALLGPRERHIEIALTIEHTRDTAHSRFSEYLYELEA